ncbi:MAG: hypothetical protein ACR2NW_01975 [Thermodesulfobacteriota bacterium]
MKIILIVATILFLSSPAYTCQINNANQGINSNFNYNNVAYKTVLPFSKMSESKNFNIEKGDFPVGFGQIIKIAKGLTKKIDIESNWSIESVALYKYNYSNCTFWYYQINMRSNNPSNNYVYLNIGINGEEPNVYKINEVLIN